MKRNVVFGKVTWTLTVVCSLLLAGCLVACTFEKSLFIIYCVIIIPTLLASLWYCPMNVEVTDKELYLNRSISPSKRFALADITSIQAYEPPLSTIRLCGSGGMLGYWGWFRDRHIGRYFAYYGRAKDCFLIELTNGKKYLLGCEDSTSIIEAVEVRLAEIRGDK